jgi:heat-inducible transcriptional repressor
LEERDKVQELSQRQQDILGTAVREYIGTAKPVGSDAICQSCGLGVSSATVRNEFATLTDMGYLSQPHTSAGRVPTAKGYRYFVEQLMEQSVLPASEQLLIRHQFHQISLDLDQWIRLAATVLARISQSASLITAPQARQVHFRHVELISISEFTGLMILVLQDSSVHQQMMVFGSSVSQEDLSRISNKLNERYANLDADQARAQMQGRMHGEGDALEAEVSRRIVELLHSHEVQSGREIYRDGLVHILRQPEFGEIERARQVVQVLEEDSTLEAIFSDAHLANGVQVIIGSEGKWDEIRDCSLILSGYGLPGEADGVVGVLGPMRMPYGRAVSAVRYVAGLMNDLLHRLYGE